MIAEELFNSTDWIGVGALFLVMGLALITMYLVDDDEVC